YMFIGSSMINRLYIIEIQYSKQVRFIGDVTDDRNNFNIFIGRRIGLLDGQLLMNTIKCKLGQLIEHDTFRLVLNYLTAQFTTDRATSASDQHALIFNIHLQQFRIRFDSLSV